MQSVGEKNILKMSYNTTWYIRSTIVTPTAATTLAVIVRAIWAFWLNPPLPDFSFSINPKHRNQTIKMEEKRYGFKYI
ncbi:hypothetical protein ANME2D_03417 [Candidatus Methanoperedens nitroreducens]|uniref:Uncharacterized protein n=1 Tax=Candidatus Methanoperedens nitratireducens TaxID=1392998 RepID=A0A062UTC1_9EURY|nr:hypothetical protein [Candidatus Methanoperedens nitroreducens]KCZ70301.1 hypothetical protein ANME2D_03417 [Candidatus Methanoperedens nitroreducens]MDJ1421339.1 hypothetical protein [Candidatus Methanoperedens sp.]